MNNITTNIPRVTKAEIWVAKAYVFCMVLRLFQQLDFLQTIFNRAAFYLSFLFHVAGLFLWCKNENGCIKIPGANGVLFSQTTRTFLWLNFSSLIMACVVQVIEGSYAGETAFSGIVGMEVFFFQYLFMFMYNIRVFQLLSLEELNSLIHKSCIFLLCLGYLQIPAMFGIGAGLYEKLNFLGVARPLERMTKLSLTGNEGAAAGMIIGAYVLPFLLSNIGKGKRYGIELLLWIIPIFFTFSATCYTLVLIDLAVFFFIQLRKRRLTLKWIRGAILSLLIVGSGYIYIRVTDIMTDEMEAQLFYNMFEKSTDLDNASTNSRSLPLFFNWGAFTEYPILGVGNGLQGYFFIKYFPRDAFREGSDASEFYEIALHGIANGGVFFPALLSGYGIVGCIVIILFVISLLRQLKRIRGEIGNFYDFFQIGSIAILAVGFQGDLYGVYMIWFVLSIPFMGGIHKTNTYGHL